MTPAAPASGRQAIRRAEIAMLLVVLIWGGNFAVIKAALREFPPLAFSALRFLFATVVLLVVVRTREGSLGAPPRSWGRFLWLGLIGNTLYQVLFIYGLNMTTADSGALIVSSNPIWVALLGAMTGVERLTRAVVGGIVLAFAGVSLVLGAGMAGSGPGVLLGDLAILGSTLCWSAYTLGVRSVRVPISDLRLTALTMVTGTPGLLLVGLPQLATMPFRSLSAGAWAGLAYSAFLALIAAYVLWNGSVRVLGGARTAIFGCGIPFVTMLIAWPFLGERPPLLSLVGAGLIVGGVLISRRAPAVPIEPAS
jgi:drug/metabolite transporter (DMT)-like permease